MTDDLDRLRQFCAQVAADGILPSRAWFAETADTLDALAAARLALQQEHEQKITECGQWKEAACKKIRTWEAIQSRHRAGDEIPALARDYGVPEEFICWLLYPENDLEARYARGSDRAKTARADLAKAEAARTTLRQQNEELKAKVRELSKDSR
jgi:predicted kinase